MISRLPKWIIVGGGVLAFIAGIINAVGFLGLYHQGITHLTGTTSLLGIAAMQQDVGAVIHLAGFIASFVAGAVLSGIIIQDSALKLGRRYGVALLVESLLLFAAVPLLRRGLFAGDCLASSACGLQNAMVSTFSGASLRTTHLSGVFTDVGVFIGHWLRRLPVDIRRLRLWLLIVFSFATGSAAGAWLFVRMSYNTLLVPAVLTGFAGVAYGIYRHEHEAIGPRS